LLALRARLTLATEHTPIGLAGLLTSPGRR
jgi:hypothetical protein